MRRTLPLILVLTLVFTSDLSSAATDDPNVCVNGTPDAAIAACTREISAGTLSTAELVVAYCTRGLHFAEKGELDSALADFNRANKLDPKSAAPYSGRG